MKASILFGGLLVACATWWLVQQSIAAPPLTTSQAPPRPRVPATRSTAPRDVVLPSPAVPLPEEPAPQAPAEPAAEPSIADQQTNLQARFAGEGIDAGWASTSRLALRDDLGRFSGKDVRILDVECRSSLCRAELLLTSHEAGRTFMESWLRARSWRGPGFVASDDETAGGAKLVVYLGRPGNDLPYVE
jgi:hypothetical protein